MCRRHASERTPLLTTDFNIMLSEFADQSLASSRPHTWEKRKCIQCLENIIGPPYPSWPLRGIEVQRMKKVIHQRSSWRVKSKLKSKAFNVKGSFSFRYSKQARRQTLKTGCCHHQLFLSSTSTRFCKSRSEYVLKGSEGAMTEAHRCRVTYPRFFSKRFSLQGGKRGDRMA